METNKRKYRNQYGLCGEMVDGKIRCNFCGQWLLADSHFFWVNKRRRFGFESKCKDCGRKKLKHTTDRRKARVASDENHLVCTRCGVEKELTADNFNRCSYNKTGFRGVCRECRHKENINNMEKIVARSKKYRLRKPEKYKQYRKEYFQRNKAKLNEQRKERRKNDPYCALEVRLSNRVRVAVRCGYVKNKRTRELLGCTYEELKIYLESLFTDGMSWEKFMNGEIHVDHVIPIVHFDLIDPKQQEECFNHKNLQPMWAFDNLSKNSNYNGIRLRQWHKKKCA